MPQILWPAERIETERLILQKSSIAYAEDVCAALAQDRERLEEFLPWVGYVHSLEQAREGLGREAEAWDAKDAFCYVVVDKSTQEFVGEVCVCEVVEPHGRGELDFWLKKQAQGRGYATEALAGLVAELWTTGFHRLEISAAATNERSQRVAQRLGFEFEGSLKDHYFAGGRYHDELVFAKVMSD